MKYLKRFFEAEDFDFFGSLESPEQITKYDFNTDNYNSEVWMPKNKAIFAKLTYWFSL
jgi:hypothetical protein